MGNYNSDQKNARFYGLKLSRNTDAEMIKWLDKQDSVQGYLKNIIKEDLMKMKRFYIKEDYLTLWGSECDEDTIVTYQEVENLSREWDEPIEELLDQLIEIEGPQWFIVDNALSARGEIFDRPLHTDDKMEAFEAAMNSWNYRTDSEKENRDDFYIALAETNRYGHINDDTVTETVGIKNPPRIKYQVNLTDANGATSAIDTVEATYGYTAEDYIRACDQNADEEWCDMIASGTVTVEEI